MSVFAFTLDGARFVTGRYRDDIHSTIPGGAVAVSEAIWTTSLEMDYPKLALDGSLSNAPPAYNLAAHRAQAKAIVARRAQAAQSAASASQHLDPATLFALILEVVEWTVRINPQPEGFPLLNAEATARAITIPTLIDEIEDLIAVWRPRYAAIHGARAKALRDIDAASTEGAITAVVTAATTLIQSL